MRKVITVLLVIILVLVGAVAYTGYRAYDGLFGRGPDPETIATASLEGLREQNVLVPFAARFVAVVTSRQSRFGLSAEKTLIMPGTVQYELDLAKLQQQDVQWNKDSNTLTVTLPPIRVSAPQVDLNGIQQYEDGKILLTLTDAEQQLDTANKKAARQELVAQAKQETPMRLARNAAKSAIERSFAMPLRAAGLNSTVVARFANEGTN